MRYLIATALTVAAAAVPLAVLALLIGVSLGGRLATDASFHLGVVVSDGVVLREGPDAHARGVARATESSARFSRIASSIASSSAFIRLPSPRSTDRVDSISPARSRVRRISPRTDSRSCSRAYCSRLIFISDI